MLKVLRALDKQLEQTGSCRTTQQFLTQNSGILQRPFLFMQWFLMHSLETASWGKDLDQSKSICLSLLMANPWISLSRRSAWGGCHADPQLSEKTSFLSQGWRTAVSWCSSDCTALPLQKREMGQVGKRCETIRPPGSQLHVRQI